jgi:hypothetical protein
VYRRYTLETIEIQMLILGRLMSIHPSTLPFVFTKKTGSKSATYKQALGTWPAIPSVMATRWRQDGIRASSKILSGLLLVFALCAGGISAHAEEDSFSDNQPFVPTAINAPPPVPPTGLPATGTPLSNFPPQPSQPFQPVNPNADEADRFNEPPPPADDYRPEPADPYNPGAFPRTTANVLPIPDRTPPPPVPTTTPNFPAHSIPNNTRIPASRPVHHLSAPLQAAVVDSTPSLNLGHRFLTILGWSSPRTDEEAIIFGAARPLEGWIVLITAGYLLLNSRRRRS